MRGQLGQRRTAGAGEHADRAAHLPYQCLERRHIPDAGDEDAVGARVEVGARRARAPRPAAPRRDHVGEIDVGAGVDHERDARRVARGARGGDDRGVLLRRPQPAGRRRSPRGCTRPPRPPARPRRSARTSPYPRSRSAVTGSSTARATTATASSIASRDSASPSAQPVRGGDRPARGRERPAPRRRRHHPRARRVPHVHQHQRLRRRMQPAQFLGLLTLRAHAPNIKGTVPLVL